MGNKSLETHVYYSQTDSKKIKIKFDALDSLKDGKIITKKYAKEIVERKWASLGSNKKNAAITFDKRAIMFILSQKDCQGIRFYFATYLDELGVQKETIVLIGIDDEKNDLSTDYKTLKDKKRSIIIDPADMEDDLEETIIIEVGGGNYKTDFERDLTP